MTTQTTLSQCPQCEDVGDFDAETGECANCFYPAIQKCAECDTTSDRVRFATADRCLPCYHARERAIRAIASLKVSIATVPWEG
jgi:hypothetical protein